MNDNQQKPKIYKSIDAYFPSKQDNNMKAGTLYYYTDTDETVGIFNDDGTEIHDPNLKLTDFEIVEKPVEKEFKQEKMR